MVHEFLRVEDSPHLVAERFEKDVGESLSYWQILGPDGFPRLGK